MYRLTITILIFTIGIVNVVPVMAKDPVPMVTDRPTQSLSASTMPTRLFLWESGTLLEISPTEESWTYNNSLFRYGVSKSVELRLVTDFKTTKQTAINIDDIFYNRIELGFKYRFVNKKFQMAYTGHVIFPNNNTTISDIVGKQVGASNVISASHPVLEILNFGYNIGYKHLGTNTDILLYSFVVSTAIVDRLGFYAEIYGDSFELQDYSFGYDNGFTYLILPNLQIDLSFALSFNESYNYYGLGLSWQFGKGVQINPDDVENY